MNRYQFVVFTNPKEGQEAEYNRWYNEQHLPDVLRVPGFVAAQRFLIADEAEGVGHRYLALYEIETDDLARTMNDLKARVGTQAMIMSDAIDLKGVSATMFQPLTPRMIAGCP